MHSGIYGLTYQASWYSYASVRHASFALWMTQCTLQTFLYINVVSLTTKQITVWRARLNTYVKSNLLTADVIKFSLSFFNCFVYTCLFNRRSNLPLRKAKCYKNSAWNKEMPLGQVKIVFIDNYKTLGENWIEDNNFLINNNCFVLRKFSKFWNYRWTDFRHVGNNACSSERNLKKAKSCLLWDLLNLYLRLSPI